MKPSLKRAIAAILGAGMALPLAAHADGRWGYQRWDHDSVRLAHVVKVRPIVRVMRVPGPTVRHCTTEQVAYSRDRHADPVGATLVGGVIGGVIGNRLGDDGGNPVATVAGAIIGGAIGHSLADGRTTVVRPMTVCHPQPSLRTVERIRGYRVTYRYHGRLYVTRMHQHPGRFLRVHRDASPLD